MSGKFVRYSVEFKREALRRMVSCRNVSALACELGIRRKFLYQWRAAFQERGEQGLRSRREKGPPVEPGAAGLPTPLVKRRLKHTPSLQVPSPPIDPRCGGRPVAAHRFDLHRKKGFSSSMRRMRSRISSFSMTSSAMTDFIRRPCSPTTSLLPDLEASLVTSHECPAPMKAPRQ
jgi:transposase-like protein